MPKTKKRGKGNRGDKEKPLLTVQGVLKLEKSFVTAQHSDAPTMMVRKDETAEPEEVKLVPGQSEHEMVEYKAGYDMGPTNPYPQNDTEAAIYKEQKAVEQRQEEFEEMKRQSEAEKAERELLFRQKEEDRERRLGKLPDVPPGTEEEQEGGGGGGEDKPEQVFNPDDPSMYVLPDQLSKEPAFHNDSPLEFASKPVSPVPMEDESQENSNASAANVPNTALETEETEDIGGTEEQQFPEEQLPQMRPLPDAPVKDKDVAKMALNVAKEMEVKRRREARERLMANQSDDVEEDHDDIIYSLDELTRMKEAASGGAPVQGPELSQSNIEQVVKQQKDKDAKNILDGYWQFVRENPQDFNGWCYLVQHVENMDELEEVRTVYNAFLPLYPYCYAYWQRYSDVEKKHEHWQRALAILHRGLEAIPLSVDLWITYLELYYKMYQGHDDFGSLFRAQCERAIQTVGLDFKSDLLWERYIEWEAERKELAWMTGIYKRLVTIPTKLFNKHWDNFIAHIRDHHPRDILEYEDYEELRKVTCKELGLTYRPDPFIQPVQKREVVMPEDKLKAGMKERIVASVVADHENCEQEVDKRFRFEEKIKRNYFHVKPLDLKQLRNWESYLDFEIEQGDHERIVVLFERCLIPTAQYEQFWAKYARYLEQHHKSKNSRPKTNAKEGDVNRESPLTRARFAFSTGLTKVDEIREKRCTWTLRGWKGKDKEGNEIMIAEEIPTVKDAKDKKDKGGKTTDASPDEDKTLPEAEADEQKDEDEGESEIASQAITTEDETLKDIIAEDDEEGGATKSQEGDENKDEETREAPPEEDKPGFHQRAIDREMNDVTKTAHHDGREAVRDVYKRVCIVHCPKKAMIKLKWAAFEEQCGETERAREILGELSLQYPLLLECCIQLIDLERREGNLDKADELYKTLMKKIPQNRKSIKTWVALKYARFQFKVRKLPDKALATLRQALKKERGEPKLYAQIIDICYQRNPVDVAGVTAAIELALKSPTLTNMQKLEFVKRKVEFMQEFGGVARYRDAVEQIKSFRLLCAADLKVQAKKKRELEREEQKMKDLEALKARVRAEANMKAKLAEQEGRLMCTSCQGVMYPDAQGVYEFEKDFAGPRRQAAAAGQRGEGGGAPSLSEAVDDDGVVDLMDWLIPEEQEEQIKKKLEEKTRYKEVAPTWELNMETYGYGKRRKVYDPDYEHVESSKFREYERLEAGGYDEELKDPDHDKLKNINAPGLGSSKQSRNKEDDKMSKFTTSDYVVPPKVTFSQLLSFYMFSPLLTDISMYIRRFLSFIWVQELAH